VHVYLPDLLSTDRVDLEDFLTNRIHAHCPGIDGHAVRALLRRQGLVLLGDAFDRLSPDSRATFSARLRVLLRDAPRAQVFLSTRPGLLPDVELPVLLLEELDPSQQRALVGTDEMRRRRYHGLSSFHQRLATHPLLLTRMLASPEPPKGNAEGILPLFEGWFGEITSSRSPETHATREAALHVLANATAGSPLSTRTAARTLKDAGYPAGTLDDLNECGALAWQQETVEIVHEALADYIRARFIAELDETEQAKCVDSLKTNEGSFLPVLLAALLPTRTMQNRLWRRIGEENLEVLAGALRFKGDTSSELANLPPALATEAFLSDVLDGVTFPLLAYFAPIRREVCSLLCGEHAEHLGVVGRLDSGHLNYRYVAKSPESAEVQVSGILRRPLRYVKLQGLGFRTDEGMRLGMTDLRKALKKLVDHQLLDGGPIWTEELAIGRLRLLEKQTGFPFRERPISELCDDLATREGSTDTTSIDEIVALLERLRSTGHERPLDLWWDATTPTMTNDEAKVWRIGEHFRRLQLAYAEVVEHSLGTLKASLATFPALPVRYNLLLVQSQANTMERLFHDASPAQTWEGAGADVSFAAEPPDRLPWDTSSERRARFTRAGRHAPHLPWYSPPPMFGMCSLRGTFDGGTSVTREVTDLLRWDLEKLFAPLDP
ncbi:MAG TPA: hypothetical protein VLC09_15060, partial [Polyangiaceae bacterium]|nr:hypothetical protein [Polyangiaceae bacterium]